MKTRKTERIITTSDPVEMNGMFLASRVVKSWIEDFIDEDTGEVISKERKEILFNKGTPINEDILPKILFYLEDGSIKEVEVSDQCRLATNMVYSSYLLPYRVTALIDRKNTSFILKALSVQTALEAVTDYIELNYSDYFAITSVKQLKSMIIIDNEIIADENSPEGETAKDTRKYYTIEVDLMEANEDDEGEHFVCNYGVILKAQDVDSAREEIFEKLKELQATRKDDTPRDLSIKIVKAAPLSCHKVIEYDFCLAYAKDVDDVQC